MRFDGWPCPLQVVLDHDLDVNPARTTCGGGRTVAGDNDAGWEDLQGSDDPVPRHVRGEQIQLVRRIAWEEVGPARMVSELAQRPALRFVFAGHLVLLSIIGLWIQLTIDVVNAAR